MRGGVRGDGKGKGAENTCAETTSANFDACEAAAWACALAASNCCRKKSQLAIRFDVSLHSALLPEPKVTALQASRPQVRAMYHNVFSLLVDLTCIADDLQITCLSHHSAPAASSGRAELMAGSVAGYILKSQQLQFLSGAP